MTQVLMVIHIQFMLSLMMWGVMSNEDHLITHFFLKGHKVNAATYIDVLDTMVKMRF